MKPTPASSRCPRLSAARPGRPRGFPRGSRSLCDRRRASPGGRCARNGEVRGGPAHRCAAGRQLLEYLLGGSPTERDLGPIDLRQLREGVVEVETRGMLPEADIAFLDEVFLGSTAILNTLLSLLNQRTFRRGRTIMTCPLRVCVGAANSVPDDYTLSAFADRFLARLFVEPVPTPHRGTSGGRPRRIPGANDGKRRCWLPSIG